MPTPGEAERPRCLNGARPPYPLRPAVGPGPLLLPDHREQLQTHRCQDPPASAERGHGERADRQTAVAVGLGQLVASQGTTVSLQSSGEPGCTTILQRKEAAPDPPAEAAAASATWTTQGGPGQTEAPVGPEEEPQPPQSPPRGLIQEGEGTDRNTFLSTFPDPHFPNSHLKLQSFTVDVQQTRRWVWGVVIRQYLFFLHEVL